MKFLINRYVVTLAALYSNKKTVTNAVMSFLSVILIITAIMNIYIYLIFVNRKVEGIADSGVSMVDRR